MIAATSEYIGGQIRTTLIAVINRIIQRLAANAALAIVVFVAALLTVAISIATVLFSSDSVGLPAGREPIAAGTEMVLPSGHGLICPMVGHRSRCSPSSCRLLAHHHRLDAHERYLGIEGTAGSVTSSPMRLNPQRS